MTNPSLTLEEESFLSAVDLSHIDNDLPTDDSDVDADKRKAETTPPSNPRDASKW